MPGRLEGKVCVDHRGGVGHRRRVRPPVRAGRRDRGRHRPLRRLEGDFTLEVDVADEERVRGCTSRSREKYGRIDVLFNNAGINPPEDESVLDTPLETWQRVQDVNVRSVFLCCKHGIPHLIETGGGSVINTASFVAMLGAATSQISYTASKGAVLSMSRELGRRVRPPRRPGQRPLPRPGQHAAARGALRLRPRPRRPAPGPHPDGPLRRGPRDRPERAVPRLGRFVFRHRVRVHGRRRPLRGLRNPGIRIILICMSLRMDEACRERNEVGLRSSSAVVPPD